MDRMKVYLMKAVVPGKLDNLVQAVTCQYRVDGKSSILVECTPPQDGKVEEIFFYFEYKDVLLQQIPDFLVI
jgi:hypothetical protein